MPWPEDRCECEWVVCKLYTPPIAIIGLKLLRLVGIVPGTGLARGIGPLGAARVPAGTELPVGTVPARGIDRAGAVLWVLGTVRAEVPAGTDLAAGTGRVRGTDPVAGIGRLGAGPSCGCS